MASSLSFFFLYCSKKKEVTKNIYLFYYGLGTNALNTISRLGKKGWNFFLFLLKMPPHGFELKCVSIAS